MGVMQPEFGGSPSAGDRVPAESVGVDRPVDHVPDGPEGQAAEPLGAR